MVYVPYEPPSLIPDMASAEHVRRRINGRLTPTTFIWLGLGVLPLLLTIPGLFVCIVCIVFIVFNITSLRGAID